MTNEQNVLDIKESVITKFRQHTMPIHGLNHYVDVERAYIVTRWSNDIWQISLCINVYDNTDIAWTTDIKITWTTDTKTMSCHTVSSRLSNSLIFENVIKLSQDTDMLIQHMIESNKSK